MKNSIYSQVFSLLILTAHLWITPALSEITIKQMPDPAVLEKDVVLSPTGINVTATDFLACSWFMGKEINGKNTVSVYSKNETSASIKKNNFKADEICRLTITAVTTAQFTSFSISVQYKDRVETKSITVNGAKRFEMSAIILLSLAGLISSITLF